tara:strand:+ start:344 stop:532 length:189 start_codon:yes stop_codon:yes gene_type:complete
MSELEICFFCTEKATSEKGTAYYRAQLPSGKWDSVPICLRCLLKKRSFPESDKLGINELSDN